MNYPSLYITPVDDRTLPWPVRLLPLFVLAFVTIVGLLGGRALWPHLASDVTVMVAASAENSIAVMAASAPQPTTPVIPPSAIAPAFMPSVRYWGPQIEQWAATAGVDPNLAATIMQIESCGHPTVVSSAGAQGLFQVMPFHFAPGEVMTDPDTNASRGLAYLARGLELANGNAGLAMAGYNGGHSVIGRASSTWHNETQRYYQWGTGIYNDILTNPSTSPTLQAWLQAGGASLCARAEAELGLSN